MRSLTLFIVLAFVPALGQTSFPALLAEKPALEHQEKLMLFGQFLGAWKFNGVEYHDDGSHPSMYDLRVGPVATGEGHGDLRLGGIGRPTD